MDNLRLMDIESKIAYQEHMISELNTVIIDQQKQIDQLQKTVQLLLERVAELSQCMTLSSSGNEKPPHY
jgi:SlyX protein